MALPTEGENPQDILSAPQPEWIPPFARTGMRGTSGGGANRFHQLVADPDAFDWSAAEDVDEITYDMVVVGAGISGLTAAYLAQKKMGKSARILILEHDDDFGGHARRNEFNVDGTRLIGYGGSQSIDSPETYSLAAIGLLQDLGVDVERFYRYFDQSFYRRRGMGAGIYVRDRGPKGQLLVNRSDDGFTGLWEKGEDDASELNDLISGLHVSEADKTVLWALFGENSDWLSGLDEGERISFLRQTSFEQCLISRAGLSDEAAKLLRDHYKGLWGVGWDALSGLEAVRLDYPGTRGLGLAPDLMPNPYNGTSPYIFHFPDGNASIARLLVSKLVPEALAATDMDDILLADVHYDRLDRAGQPVRLRLNSTVLKIENQDNGISLWYADQEGLKRIKASRCLIAGWGRSLPFLIPEMSAKQADALRYGEKMPIAYINVALRNWRAFEHAGVRRIYLPDGLITSIELDFPVSMPGYAFPQSPDEPIIAHLLYAPAHGAGDIRAQARQGRQQMLGMTFDDFDREIRMALDGALGLHGFNSQNDIADITVNLWPHGYSYEYSDLADPEAYARESGPHVTGRARIGKIAIAGSDSSAYAYLDGAIDAAHRALNDIL